MAAGNMSYLYCPECGVYTNASGQDFSEDPCSICEYWEEPLCARCANEVECEGEPDGLCADCLDEDDGI